MIKVKTIIPVLGLAAYSGTGKTTLLINIIPLLKKRGIEIGVIKHAHHAFEIDQPGKDSYEIRKAGASQMLIGSKQRWVLMVEQNEEAQKMRLEEYISQLDQKRLNLILVEGFKSAAIPKIELHRPGLGHPLISSDAPLSEKTELSILDLNNHEMIVEYIIDNVCNDNDRKTSDV